VDKSFYFYDNYFLKHFVNINLFWKGINMIAILFSLFVYGIIVGISFRKFQVRSMKLFILLSLSVIFLDFAFLSFGIHANQVIIFLFIGVFFGWLYHTKIMENSADKFSLILCVILIFLTIFFIFYFGE